MSCLHPILHRNNTLTKSFKDYFLVPCGHCIPCIIAKRSKLEKELDYEWKRLGSGCFITLTYDDAHLLYSCGIRTGSETLFTLRKEDYSTIY